MSAVLDAALSYAKRGWFVFPVHGIKDGGACACGVEACGSPGKHPLTSNGLDAATTNAQVIKNWWAMTPGANVAIRTGAESGLVVLDFDHAEGVALSETMSSLPTPRVNTGGGGRHWFLAHPGFPVGNRARMKPGLDVRADRGYVVAPPSRHASGGTYEWQEFLTPADTDLAPLTEDILELLRAGKSPVVDAEIVTTGDPKKDAPVEMFERAKAYVSKMPGAVAGDGGHDQTFVVALKLVHGFRLSNKQAGVILQEYNKKCQPPWDLKDLEHKIRSARTDAHDPVALAKAINPNAGQAPWLSTVQMTQTKNGFLPIPILANAVIYLTHEVNPLGTPRRDAFSGKLTIGSGESLRPYTNADLHEINIFLQHEDRKLYVGKDITQDAVETIANRNEYHPVRDWLASLKWDGKQRAATWIIRHGGARDDAYVRAVSSKWLIGAVARVFKPGCRMDTMLILEGAQGSRKSTTVEVLGRPWAAGLTNQALHGEAAVEQLSGKWLIEMSELDGLRRSEVSAAKDFISRTGDYYREKYGRVATDHPRQSVLIGTCNQNQYLQDSSGGRRFWPVAITHTIDTDALANERDQLFAEAVALYYSGIPWHLDASEEVLARDEQAQRIPDDAWSATILRWLLTKLEDAPLLKSEVSVSTAEIMEEALEIPPAHQSKADQMRISDVMRREGWEKRRVTFGKLQANRWFAPPEEKA